jgi:hypothetical protein
MVFTRGNICLAINLITKCHECSFLFYLSLYLFSSFCGDSSGIEPPAWDKGICTRMVAYAGVIAWPNLKRHASLVNIEATKRFSRSKDKKLAWFYIISSVSIFTLGIFIYYLYIHKS